MGAIMKIAKKHKLKVVTDSCETMFVNQHRGDITCFSTYVAHLMVTGVGGFACTNDDKLAVVMRSMMFHGRDESYLNIDDKPKDISKRFYFPRFGYSDRMTELEAALGLGDLDNWEDIIDKRHENAWYLMDKLILENDLYGELSIPVIDYFNHAFMFFPMYAKRRDELAEYLEERGIQTRLMMPLISQPTAKPYVKKKYPVAQYIEEHGLLLPCHQYLSKKDLDFIIDKIRSFYA
jgi:dTDP-4-amino-4,6-dideoxygalactose transaminase